MVGMERLRWVNLNCDLPDCTFKFETVLETATLQLTWHGEVIVREGKKNAPNTLHYWPHPSSELVTIIYKTGLFTATEARRGRMETESNKRVIYIYIPDLRRKIPILRHS